MRALITLFVFIPSLWGQRTHPSMIIDSTMLGAMKAKAVANSAQWRALKGSTALPLTCDWGVQYTAGTPDHLPPVYGYREPNTAYGTPAGYVRTGTDGAYYQGGEAAAELLNLSVCYLTLKDGDVDVVGSTPGTSDELALAANYAAQAIKLLNKFTLPYAKITPSAPPAIWEGFDWEPAYYVDKSSDAVGCTGSARDARPCAGPYI